MSKSLEDLEGELDVLRKLRDDSIEKAIDAKDRSNFLVMAYSDKVSEVMLRRKELRGGGCFIASRRASRFMRARNQ